MGEQSIYYITENEKNNFIDLLTPELSYLRAKANISQEELSNLIGVSRQTYGTIERKAKRMSWGTYLSLIMFFDTNSDTHQMFRNSSAFPKDLFVKFNYIEEAVTLETGRLFGKDTDVLVETLDNQAMSTLKTVLMVEYSRCNNISGGEVIKFFEGLNLNTGIQDGDTAVNAAKALKNIKRNR